MNVDLTRRMALVAYGNAFLAGLVERPPDLFSEHAAFQHVRSVDFRMAGRSIHRVDLWFSALAKRGAKRLLLRADDMAVEGEGVREVWIPSWVLLSRRFELSRWRALDRLVETGDRRLLDTTSSRLVEAEHPWRLYYDQESRRSKARRGPMLEASRSALIEAVTDAQAYSRRHKTGFVGSLGKSLALLRSRNAAACPRSALLPTVGYSDDARRLAVAAEQAWVFGPWGWSDSVTGTDSAVQALWHLDARLRKAVVEALIAATNSFDESSSRSRSGLMLAKIEEQPNV